MIVVAHIDPHPRISGFTGGEHGHDGVIGAHHVGGAYPFTHQFPQRLEQIRHVAAPDRLCGARDFEALAGENVLDTVERKVLGKFAGCDIGQQTGSGQSLVNRRLRLGCGFHPRVVAVVFARRAGVLLAHMMQAFKMAGVIFDLPALVGTDLLALNTTARTRALFGTQFVNLRGDGEIFEVGQVPPSLTPFHTPYLFLWFRRRRGIVRVNRLAVHLLGEDQQQLPQIAGVLKAVCSRAVIPLLVSLEFQLRTQQFKMKIVGSPLEYFRSACLLLGTLLLALAFCQQGLHHGYKRFAIIGELNIQRRHTLYMHHFWSSDYTVAVPLLSEMVRAPRS